MIPKRTRTLIVSGAAVSPEYPRHCVRVTLWALFLSSGSAVGRIVFVGPGISSGRSGAVPVLHGGGLQKVDRVRRGARPVYGGAGGRQSQVRRSTREAGRRRR